MLGQLEQQCPLFKALLELTKVVQQKVDAGSRPEVPVEVDELLTAEQIAEILKVRKNRVYELARSAGLPSVKIGRYLRFPRQGLAEWLEKNMSHSNNLQGRSLYERPYQKAK